MAEIGLQNVETGDSSTLSETLTTAAEQVEAVQPDGEGVEEVVADKGYHTDKTLVSTGSPASSSTARPTLGNDVHYLRGWQDQRDIED